MKTVEGFHIQKFSTIANEQIGILITVRSFQFTDFLMMAEEQMGPGVTVLSERGSHLENSYYCPIYHIQSPL